jgi:hypothetical protein
VKWARQKSGDVADLTIRLRWPSRHHSYYLRVNAGQSQYSYPSAMTE